MIEVAVISPSRPLLLPRALASVREQKQPQQGFCFRGVENDSRVDREKEILTSQAQWILFIDEDCSLPDRNYLCRLENIFNSAPEVSIWGGLYQDPPAAAYSVKAYNRLCNTWVLAAKDKNLLGGCLAIHVPSAQPFIDKNPIAWGGEDTYLLRQLQRAGLQSRLHLDMNVIHAPREQSLHKVISRGWVHGRHRQHFRLQTENISRSAFRHGFKNFQYWPFWLAHFSSVAVGSSAQIFAPTGNYSRSAHKKT